MSKTDIDKFHEVNLYLPKRLMWIGSETNDDDMNEGGCDYLMAERAVKNLAILQAAGRGPVNILMNNVGGDEYHGFAIYDAIKACKSKVTITVFGHAMSMGSIILQAADVRIMAPTSRQMVHYGTWGVHDHAKTAQQWAKEGIKIDHWMEEMYLKRIREKWPRFPLSRLRKMLDHDTFITAEASVEYGLADKVLK